MRAPRVAEWRKDDIAATAAEQDDASQMSLVVAHRISYGVRLSADLRVTNANATRIVPGYLSGVLKAVIVHPHVCVAFAGKPVTAAIDAIRRLDILPDSAVDVARIADLLLDSHRRVGEIDFLLATLHPTVLARIGDGAVAWDLPTAWIGDYDAFALFQHTYLEENPVLSRFADVLPEDEFNDLVVADRSIDALQAVINFDLPTVGESGIFVVPRPPQDANAGFAYLESSLASTGRPRPTHPGVNPLQAGSAPHGDFSFAILAPTEPGIGAMAIYFLEGQLGLLYYPMKFDDPRRFPNVSVADFKDAVHAEHGFSLRGIGIGASD
jgi:hypothetical protein